MKKPLIGLLVLALLAGGAYWGIVEYPRQRAQSEVEAVFASMRASGREASHGPVGFDLFSRTLVIPSVSIRQADGAALRIENLVASGVEMPAPGRVTIRSVEIDGASLDLPQAKDRLAALYQAPRLTLEGYDGPAGLVAGGTAGEPALALILRQFAAANATRLSAREITARIGAPGTPAASMAATYRDVFVDGMAQGRITRAGFGLMTADSAVPNGTPDQQVKTRLSDFRAIAIDTAPIQALAEGRAGAGRGTIYGQITARDYSLAYSDGARMSAATLEAKDIALDPARLTLARLDELQSLGEAPQPLSEADTRRLLGAAGDVVRAIAIADFALQDIQISDPAAKIGIGTIRLAGLADGRLDRFEMAGMRAELPGEKPFAFDRLVLRGLNPLPLLDLSARAAVDQDLPAFESALAMVKALEGVELAGLKAGLSDSDVPLTIAALRLDWGQVKGLVPTRMTLSGTGISGPISEADGAPLAYLAAAGANSVTFGFDIVVAYDTASRSIRLSPGSIKVDDAFSLDLDATLTHVRPDAFEDPIAALSAAQLVAVGPIRLTLKNLGLAALVLKEKAAGAGISPEALTAELVGQIRASVAELAPLYPEAAPLADALIAFLEKPGTLTLSVTPLADARLMDLIGADPMALVRDFSLTATAGP